MVGFTGSRSLGSQWAALVNRVVAGFAGQPLAVGCASGADNMVQKAAPAAMVFYAAAFGSQRFSFAARSISMVQCVASSPAPLLVGFVAGSCPAGLVPSANPSKCFSGKGSGSWASLALAVGLGVPVVVFWCAAGRPALPAAWGVWSAVQGGYRLSPVQAGLLG